MGGEMKPEQRRNVRVLLADNFIIARKSVRTALEQFDEIEVIGEVSEGRNCINQVRNKGPDIVIMNSSITVDEGMALCQQLKENFPDTKVIIFSTRDDPEFVMRYFNQARVDGYLSKENTDINELHYIITKIIQGGRFVDPFVAEILLGFHEKQKDRDINEERLEDLTQQELNILILLGQGLTNKEIAAQLYLGSGTVRNYVSNILHKLGLKSRAAATIYALKHSKIIGFFGPQLSKSEGG
ncbi:response regulator transcription factor [Metallumcola ferriviriculae]|uniref:Stage 0 sporulation protein A homolog n=1 Tax=Metallumcola ferriviriculae TaxID=3039180 RepID=A0AAU0URU8_9FIRM|nr:response regulator transcription factor [Desulfitibacteraceae bacterium MK1]